MIAEDPDAFAQNCEPVSYPEVKGINGVQGKGSGGFLDALGEICTKGSPGPASPPFQSPETTSIGVELDGELAVYAIGEAERAAMTKADRNRTIFERQRQGSPTSSLSPMGPAGPMGSPKRGPVPAFHSRKNYRPAYPRNEPMQGKALRHGSPLSRGRHSPATYPEEPEISQYPSMEERASAEAQQDQNHSETLPATTDQAVQSELHIGTISIDSPSATPSVTEPRSAMDRIEQYQVAIERGEEPCGDSDRPISLRAAGNLAGNRSGCDHLHGGGGYALPPSQPNTLVMSLPEGVRGSPGSYANQPLVSPTRPGDEGGLDGVVGVPSMDRLGYPQGGVRLGEVAEVENRALLRSKSRGLSNSLEHAEHWKDPDDDDTPYRASQPGEVARELEAKYSRKVNSALNKWKHREQ